eukprot:scpid38899/ scgid2267/ PAP-associated domain-containing protein 5; Terminal uridylyltransferase 3; Topoisomerase-related function protein 4-2
MQSRYRWLQPEQEGPAAYLWSSIWRSCSFTNNEMSSVEYLPLLPCMSDVRHVDGVEDERSGDTEAIFNNPAKRRREEQIKRSPRCSSRMTTPWQKNPSYPSNVLGLHTEIEDFSKYMAPLPEELAMRHDLVNRVSAVIKEKWPLAKVDVFGSFRTGLFLPTSDIDMVLFGNWTSLPLHSLGEVLVSSGISNEEDIKVIDSARVPIVKLCDKLSKLKVDISFNMTTGVSSALMIQEYIKEYPVLDKLVILLKQFLLQRDLNEVFTGGISSYSLILLVVNFFQNHLRENADSSAADSQNPNLAVLLIEFFELYGRNFSYDTVAIRIANGGSYFDKVTLSDNHPLANPSFLTIEDPLDETNDISRASWGAVKVKSAFEHAHGVLVSAVLSRDPALLSGPSLLGRIIRISEDVIRFRESMVQKWAERSAVLAAGSTSSASTSHSYSSVLSSAAPSRSGEPRRCTTPEGGVASEAQPTGNQLTYAGAAAGAGKVEVASASISGSRLPRSNSMSACTPAAVKAGDKATANKLHGLRGRCSSASSVNSTDNNNAGGMDDPNLPSARHPNKRPVAKVMGIRAGGQPKQSAHSSATNSPATSRADSSCAEKELCSSVVAQKKRSTGRSQPDSSTSSNHRIGKSHSPPGER